MNASHIEDRYDLVSSLYGPGTITAWYLTMTSVLVSWTLHPHHRESGSIDIDLLTILTLPAVAAAHLVIQIQGLPLRTEDISTYIDFYTDIDIKTVAAIEAPFVVTETFMSVSVVLASIAGWMLCYRRVALVSFFGLACFTVECYINLSGVMAKGLQHKVGFSLYFVHSPVHSRLHWTHYRHTISLILLRHG